MTLDLWGGGEGKMAKAELFRNGSIIHLFPHIQTHTHKLCILSNGGGGGQSPFTESLSLFGLRSICGKGEVAEEEDP